MRRVLLFALLALTAVPAAFYTESAMATETPKYTVLKEDGDFELRRYEPRIVAEVSVDGDLDSASGKGFRILADYIFGNNRVAPNASVTVAPEASTKIAMTAPVSLEPIGQTKALTGAREWRVEFTMPSEYTLATLPKPNNPSIRIREIPAKTYAAVRYSGMNTESRINEENQRLVEWVKRDGLVPNGLPELARYNPPWTLPMFKRNEILIPVGDSVQK